MSSILFYSTQKTPRFDRIDAPGPDALKGRTLSNFTTSILSQNTKKIEGGFFQKKKIQKSLTIPKKRKGGPFVLLETPVCCKISKNLKGRPFEAKKIRKKVSMPKQTEKGTL